MDRDTQTAKRLALKAGKSLRRRSQARSTPWAPESLLRNHNLAATRVSRRKRKHVEIQALRAGEYHKSKQNDPHRHTDIGQIPSQTFNYLAPVSSIHNTLPIDPNRQSQLQVSGNYGSLLGSMSPVTGQINYDDVDSGALWHEMQPGASNSYDCGSLISDQVPISSNLLERLWAESQQEDPNGSNHLRFEFQTLVGHEPLLTSPPSAFCLSQTETTMSYPVEDLAAIHNPPSMGQATTWYPSIANHTPYQQWNQYRPSPSDRSFYQYSTDAWPTINQPGHHLVSPPSYSGATNYITTQQREFETARRHGGQNLTGFAGIVKGPDTAMASYNARRAALDAATSVGVSLDRQYPSGSHIRLDSASDVVECLLDLQRYSGNWGYCQRR